MAAVKLDHSGRECLDEFVNVGQLDKVTSLPHCDTVILYHIRCPLASLEDPCQVFGRLSIGVANAIWAEKAQASRK